MTMNVNKSGWINGDIEDPKIIRNQLPNFNRPLLPVAGIVLHRTAGDTADGAITHFRKIGVGTHFIVDYSGDIYQTVSLLKQGDHIKPARPHRLKNRNSIGIEVVGRYANKEKKTYVVPKGGQVNSTVWLVASLLRYFKLGFAPRMTVCTHAEIDKPGRGAYEGTQVLRAISGHHHYLKRYITKSEQTRRTPGYPFKYQ